MMRGDVRFWPIATDRILVADRRFRGITDMSRGRFSKHFELLRGEDRRGYFRLRRSPRLIFQVSV